MRAAVVEVNKRTLTEMAQDKHDCRSVNSSQICLIELFLVCKAGRHIPSPYELQQSKFPLKLLLSLSPWERWAKYLSCFVLYFLGDVSPGFCYIFRRW